MGVNVVGVLRREIDGSAVVARMEHPRSVSRGVARGANFPAIRPRAFNDPSGWSNHGLFKGIGAGCGPVHPKHGGPHPLVDGRGVVQPTAFIAVHVGRRVGEIGQLDLFSQRRPSAMMDDDVVDGNALPP